MINFYSSYEPSKIDSYEVFNYIYKIFIIRCTFHFKTNIYNFISELQIIFLKKRILHNYIAFKIRL